MLRKRSLLIVLCAIISIHIGQISNADSEFEKAVYAFLFILLGDDVDAVFNDENFHFSMNKKCVLKVNFIDGNDSLEIKADFNKAIWSSGVYKYNELGQLVYTVNCKGKCNERSSTDDYLRILYALIPKDLWEWQLHVSRDRFEKALRDLSAICPGVKSTY